MDETAWLVIPARGGSVGVPRKNLRLLGGRPLITHAIECALGVTEPRHVVVITDDHEISHVADSAGATVIFEDTPTPGHETLDTKILRNLPKLQEMGARDDDIVATMQPTSPMLRSGTVEEVLRTLRAAPLGSAITVTEDRHLRWGVGPDGSPTPMFAERVNRQQLPPTYKETGGVVAARLGRILQIGTRIIEPVQLVPLTDAESIDIDDFADLYAAQHHKTRMRIALRADAAPHLGMGHVYRALAIALELARHDVRIYLSEEHRLGQEFFASKPFDTRTVRDDADFIDQLVDFNPTLVLLDVLDTSIDLVQGLRRACADAKIVTFEDRGPGAAAADLHVAEFISNTSVPPERTISGIGNSLMAPVFETMTEPAEFHPAPEHVLVLFGGTDPSGLAERALRALDRASFTGSVTVVRGLGASRIDYRSEHYDLEILTDVRYMPDVIQRADFAFTSAGRTVIELAALGVPSICMAQNAKELTHTHATEESGVQMLGLGSSTDDSVIDEALDRMLRDEGYRRKLRVNALASVAGRSNHRTLTRILSSVGLDRFPNL
ncbi:cytidylyltransferase domain-containing protein [Nocardioides sp.]|uniref:cytidylyltransferase domain-containing protein n=1 Tax=Nocardioides sp. TaxID=35761 RepID=UPI003783E32D